MCAESWGAVSLRQALAQAKAGTALEREQEWELGWGRERKWEWLIRRLRLISPYGGMWELETQGRLTLALTRVREWRVQVDSVTSQLADQIRAGVDLTLEVEIATGETVTGRAIMESCPVGQTGPMAFLGVGGLTLDTEAPGG